MTRPALPALGLAVLLAACAGDGAPVPPGAETGAAQPTATDTGARASGQAATGQALPLPQPQPGAPASPEAGRRPVDPAEIRDIYLAFDGAAGGTISVIFAIDADADGDPSDEPAIRLSPESGACKPQELSRYTFPPGTPPVFGLEQAQRGVTPEDLPLYMAASVTDAMLARGLAPTREDTRAQNVCTRKLWELMVANQRARVEATGQL
ncbi:MAG: hypothetical protein RQ752_16500 [Thermohalobaculum sp.]|nr:hypothetical protein [Thermohalobaculum sp.]